jgi:cytosine/adenosine deaminase-related metal-dependent hydrolase
MKTILSHANLIDCVEPQVRPDTAVLIEDGRIRAILPSREAGSAGDAQIIDLNPHSPDDVAILSALDTILI